MHDAFGYNAGCGEQGRSGGTGVAIGRKKVIVRRFTPGTLAGYLPASGVTVGAEGAAQLDLLDLSGRLQPVPLQEVKYVAYVRDFNSNDMAHPERLMRKTFGTRPRAEGLWLRLTLRDEDVIEGLAALDLSFADGLITDGGLHLVPPDIRGNTQRLFLPRPAITAMQILGVITAPSRRPAVIVQPAADEQPDLFSLTLPANTRPQ